MSKSPKPRVRIQKSSGETVKPMMKQARNWATAQYRAAQYSSLVAVRYILLILLVLFLIVIVGLWFSGGLGGVLQKTGAFLDKTFVSAGFSVKAIDVHGLEYTQRQQVRNSLSIKEGDPIFSVNLQKAKRNLEKLDWVETAIVKRLLPNRIVIYIYEKTPVAVWQSHGSFFVLDRAGKIIKTARAEYFSYLPLLVGEEAAQAGIDFLKRVSLHSDIVKNLKASVYIGKRRWNLILNDNFKILLPERNIDTSFILLERLQKKYNIFTIKSGLIDLRFDDNLIIRFDDKDIEAVQDYRKKKYQLLERGA